MQLYSLRDQVGVILKSDVGDDMTVDTIRDVFPGADWHERETHEMFGISFLGPPNATTAVSPHGIRRSPPTKRTSASSKTGKALAWVWLISKRYQNT